MSNKNNKYPYFGRLENPQTYQYSKFMGVKFITSYKLSRLETIKSLNLNQKLLGNIIPDYIKEFGHYNREILIRKISKESDTKNILSLLLFMQSNFRNKDDVIQKEVYKWLSIYIKKYEISKKIFSKYDHNMKRIGKNYKDLDNYVLLSINIALFCKNLHNLKFTNTLLKINDMLCSMREEITQKLIPLFYLSIKIELEEIEKLFNKKGLEI